MSLKCFRAMHAQGGRPDWVKKWLRPTSHQKQKLCSFRLHKDLAHLGGREGLAKAMRAEGKSWTNMDLDAAWVIKHCERCASMTTRNCAPEQVRHLPRPLQSGDCLGIDLKLVTPAVRNRWAMLLLVDFASNRVWAFDLDENKILVFEVEYSFSFSFSPYIG